jgi:indolepyruvate ferredoxin oxidoreductase beta subunit
MYNVIIAGIGGQGIITLLKVAAEAAMLQDCNVKTSELHGLSQRSGSISAHLRISASKEEIYSPIIKKGDADLIIAVEAQEALTVTEYGTAEKTIFLINNLFENFLDLSKNEIIDNEKFSFSKIYLLDTEEKRKEQIETALKDLSKKVIFVNADKICRQETSKIIAGIYLFGYAIKNRLIPLDIENAEKAIKKIIPQYQEINLRGLRN